MNKNLRFDMITLGTEFRFGTVDQMGSELFTKKSASSATDGNGELNRNIKPGTQVVITLPDPTPEEIAAREAERAEEILRWTRRALVNNVEACEVTIARFTERLAKDPYDAFNWGQGAAEAAGKLRIYKGLIEFFDANGLEATTALATRRALEGARSPQHSTAALSNIVHEAETAAYADFATRQL